MTMFATVFHALATLRRAIAITLGAFVLLGCNEKQPEALFLKESEIQGGIERQMPINGLVNVKVHIPDEVASLNGFFTGRVVSDPIVEARVELNNVEVSLVGNEAPNLGHIVLLVEPIIRTNLLGLDIAEPLNIELAGQLNVVGEKLYFEPKRLKEKGSFFLNNFVPNEYRSQFVENLNDWFVAYFSAYPLYQFTSESRISADRVGNTTLVIEDDLVRFLP